jgi:hypothetical protein
MFLHLQNFKSITLALDMQILFKGNEHLSTTIQSCKKEFDFALRIVTREKSNVSDMSGTNEVGCYQKEAKASQLACYEQLHNHGSFLY